MGHNIGSKYYSEECTTRTCIYTHVLGDMTSQVCVSVCVELHFLKLCMYVSIEFLDRKVPLCILKHILK
jgi:hypothetical protein